MTKRSYFGKLNSTLGSVVPLAMFYMSVTHLRLLPGKDLSVLEPPVVAALDNQAIGGEGKGGRGLLPQSRELEGERSTALLGGSDGHRDGGGVGDLLADLQVVRLVVLGQAGVVLLPLDPIATHLNFKLVLAGRVGHDLRVLLGNSHVDVGLDSILVADHQVGAAAKGVHVGAGSRVEWRVGGLAFGAPLSIFGSD